VTEVKQRIKRNYCPRNCGWFRDWTDTNAYRSEEFYHPTYGRVTGMVAALRDVNHHQCAAYLDAHQRMLEKGLGYMKET
jgi:hypothetical protein